MYTRKWARSVNFHLTEMVLVSFWRVLAVEEEFVTVRGDTSKFIELWPINSWSSSDAESIVVAESMQLTHSALFSHCFAIPAQQTAQISYCHEFVNSMTRNHCHPEWLLLTCLKKASYPHSIGLLNCFQKFDINNLFAVKFSTKSVAVWFSRRGHH